AGLYNQVSNIAVAFPFYFGRIQGAQYNWNIKPSFLADVLSDKIPQVSVAFIFEFVVNADFRSVVGVCDARFELDKEFLFRFLRIRLVLSDAIEQGDALLRRSLHERPPAHLV